MEIKEILRECGFRFNKGLGQNFLTDGNLLNAIVTDAGVTKDDVIVEIGAGAGTLTAALAKQAKKVYAFEVDRNLAPVLNVTLDGLDNVELYYEDILKMTDEEVKEIIGARFKVVANLPYYITTPLIMRFLESTLDVTGLTLMMQKEVAYRMTAKSNTAEYGAITVAVQAWGDTKITRIIGKELFFPSPKVDSALLRIDKVDNKFDIKDSTKFKKLVKCAFMWRRKIFANNLVASFRMTRDDATALLTAQGFAPLIRGEALSIEDFARLSNCL